MKRLLSILLLILLSSNLAAAGLDTSMIIPVKNTDIYESNRLVAGVTWHERAEVLVRNTGSDVMHDIVVTVDVPLNMDIKIPAQDVKDINIEGTRVTARIAEIKPGEDASFIFSVKPPESIQSKKTVSFPISVTYEDSTGSHVTDSTSSVEIVPPPSWVTYGTLLVSMLILIIVLIVAWKFDVLEWFTTIDLITIALLAALIGVVFRWFWQTFNDILGPFGGLLFTIPTVVLMIIALQLVRKPGTATLLFTVVELVAMVVWGTNITVWMGWYMSEGVLVDALVILFKRNYGDTRNAAMIYGTARSAFSYALFYLLFAPAVWKVYYAPWYVWTEVGIAAVGGLIGGSIGYNVARKMRGAMI